MQEITKQILWEIKRRFKTERGYVLSSDKPIYCPQVNGLVNICLNGLGFQEQARENSQRFLESPSFNREKGLFYREVDTDGKIIIPFFNTCKNAVFALNLASNGFKKDAEEILKNLKNSPLYFQDKRLYRREYNPNTDEVNPLLITQSNLCVALAYSSIGRNKESRDIIKALENTRYHQDYGLFESQDCRFTDSDNAFYLDDQALAILVYVQSEERGKADDLTKAVLTSPLYDNQTGLFNSSFSGSDVDTTKSTYKNSLMTFALERLGYAKELKRIQEGLVRELYDNDERLFNQSTRDKTKVPDNSALALVTLEYDNIKHNVF